MRDQAVDLFILAQAIADLPQAQRAIASSLPKNHHSDRLNQRSSSGDMLACFRHRRFFITYLVSPHRLH